MTSVHNANSSVLELYYGAKITLFPNLGMQPRLTITYTNLTTILIDNY